MPVVPQFVCWDMDGEPRCVVIDAQGMHRGAVVLPRVVGGATRWRHELVTEEARLTHVRDSRIV
jgi:hypothetical protein